MEELIACGEVVCDDGYSFWVVSRDDCDVDGYVCIDRRSEKLLYTRCICDTTRQVGRVIRRRKHPGEDIIVRTGGVR